MTEKQLSDFASKLRSINGLHLFKIFYKYLSFTDINQLFNYLAVNETESDLRKLEKMWDEFISIDTNEDVQETKKSP